MANFEKHSEYQVRLLIGDGHRKFGMITPRKEPKDDDEGGTGSAEFEPPVHPLLGAAAQFSGEFNEETPLSNENPDAKKELQHRYEAKQEKKMQAQKHINPKLGL